MFDLINQLLEKFVIDLIHKRNKEKEDEEYFIKILESRKEKGVKICNVQEILNLKD